jgi:hypothetical protein
MYTKKTLALAVAAGLGLGAATTAQANLDLDAGTGTTATFATETLSAATSGTVVGGDTLANVVDDDALTDFTANAAIGVGVSNTEDIFIRYDLSNAYFTAGSNIAVTSSGNYSIATAQGGTSASSFVILQANATTDVLQTETASLTLDEIAVADAGESVGLSMAVYETLTQAVSQETALKSASTSVVTPLAAFTTGISLTSTAASSGNVADVEEDFEAFTNTALDSNLALIGQLTIGEAANVASAQTGAQVTAAEMYTAATSAVTITGDLSGTTSLAGADDNQLQLATAATCAAGVATVTSNNEGTASAGLFVSALAATTFVCYRADGNTIPEGDYTVSVTFTEGSIADQDSPAATQGGDVASIAHNGTTVELPYLTTFGDYNQRIVMVNRGSQDAEYSISDFQTESDTTAVAGTAATGTIPAGGSAVVKVSDVVTLTGKTRTAATVNIVAATGNISVATTQVNLADSSTDTIVLQ